jgi:hypothetical protein
MRKHHITAALALALVLASAHGALAQTPIRPPQFVVPVSTDSLFLSGVALDGAGNLTASWTRIFASTETPYGRRFASSDVPLGAPFRLDAPRFKGTAGPVVANERGDVIMTWSRTSGQSGGVLRRTSPVLRTLTLQFPSIADVAIDRNGNFVVLWNASTPAGFRVFGQRYNADGSKRGPEFNAATSTTGSHLRPSVAMNPDTGEFVAVWEVRDAEGNVLGIFGQRFGFLTGRQGSEFAVYVPAAADRPNLIQTFAPNVARAANGSFAVVWKALPGFDILGQRYNAAGEPVGAQLRIAEDSFISDGSPQIAMSKQGDFVVSWDDSGTSPLWFQLFHRDGTPAGPVLAHEPVGFPYFGAARLAFGFNGTFVLGWTNFSDEGDFGWSGSYQRYTASPADEFCLFRNGHFLCDTGRTGGAPESDHVFAVRGGTPLLGDVDGDGRADYCLVRGANFSCDSGHDFGAAETSFNFGQPGDTPLLGDIDGDGWAEACVFRGDRFACDTTHDGGAAELEIAFGQPGDRPLLGDLDGDGRADACVNRGSQFLCDTAHNGGAAEITITFGDPGQTALLGDYDGDGRADPCVFSQGTFRCDTAHDGGTAEATLAISGAGRPLIGNLDGL